jgi:parallel beta-helix repeat protein
MIGALKLQAENVDAAELSIIRSDGSIEPDDIPIKNIANTTYAFQANITGSIDVQRSHIIIDGNGYTLDGGAGYTNLGFKILVNDVEIRNITISGFGYGLNAGTTSGLVIRNCEIVDNTYNGVRLVQCVEANLTQSQVRDNDRGVCLVSSANCTISQNNITHNFRGLWLELSPNNTVLMNNLTLNLHTGIEIHSSSDNVVKANNVTSNGLQGVVLAASCYNTVREKTIEGHTNSTYGFGVELVTNAGNNTFFHNHFRNNTVHVYIYPSANNPNAWDSDYQSGGNYWSDYAQRYPSVEDVYSGPDQNENGSDGFWDSPYVIDANNQDSYPMVPEFSPAMLLLLIVSATAAAIHGNRKKKPRETV